MRCSRCGRDAIAHIRYSGAHLCGTHLDEFVISRVKKAVREQTDLRGGARLLLAVSGGKDSLSVMHAVHRILKDRRDVEFLAVTIDEGIPGYRDTSIPLARSLCEELSIEHRVISFEKSHGRTLARMLEGLEGGPCSVCGVLRRRALNGAARDWGADHIITGINLDDTAQTVLMNLSRGDVSRLARMGPHRKRITGLVPRIQPFLRVPEKEVYLYALHNGIPIHGRECPYAERAERLRFREAVSILEQGSPGSRHGLVNAFEEIREMSGVRPSEIGVCKVCGEPSSSSPCAACRLLEGIPNG